MCRRFLSRGDSAFAAKWRADRPVAIKTPAMPVDPIDADVALPDSENGGEESVILPDEEDDEITLDEIIELEPVEPFDA
jgi:hypothetical protein